MCGPHRARQKVVRFVRLDALRSNVPSNRSDPTRAMRTLHGLIFAIACGILSACRTAPTETTLGATSPRKVDALAHDGLPIGSLSESEFEALHHLPTDSAPPHRGEMIDLVGSRAYLS